MTEIRVLNQKTVQELLTAEATIAIIEEVYREKAKKNAEIWPMIFYEFQPGKSDMDIKSGWMPELGIYGMKLVSWFGENPGKDLPALYGTTMIFDSRTGAPIGVVDAEYITGMRTGAAGAIGSKYLAKKDATTMLMVGAGHQALFQILCHLVTVPTLETIYVSDPLDSENELLFVANCQHALMDLVNHSVGVDLQNELKTKIAKINVKMAEDLSKTVPQCEIIVTATPARSPIIQQEWVAEGTHISCIGADMSGKQEVSEKLFASARIFVDDLTQAVNVGETEMAIKTGVITSEAISGEIGEVILGNSIGRSSQKEITIFDATGIALQDLAVTKHVLDCGGKNQKGQVAEL